jgi:CRP-like cAMP-binding protein
MSASRLHFLLPDFDLRHNPAPVQGGQNLDTTRNSENPSSLYDPSVALDFFRFAGKPQKIPKGTTIFSENRKGMPLLLMPNRIYLLVDGEVGIHASDAPVAVIQRGEIFGEMAPMGRTPRSASAVAISDCRVIGLDDAQFHAALTRNPGFALMLMSIMASRLRDTIASLGAPASDAKWRKAAALDKQLLADLAQVLGPAARFRYPAGRIVMTEGERGAALFAVLEGRVAIRVGDSLVEKVGRGGLFGEMSLVDRRPRLATAVAETDCALLAMSRHMFLHLVKRSPKFGAALLKAVGERAAFMASRRAERDSPSEVPAERLSAA